jgi:hypothetical protein
VVVGCIRKPSVSLFCASRFCSFLSGSGFWACGGLGSGDRDVEEWEKP